MSFSSIGVGQTNKNCKLSLSTEFNPSEIILLHGLIILDFLKWKKEMLDNFNLILYILICYILLFYVCVLSQAGKLMVSGFFLLIAGDFMYAKETFICAITHALLIGNKK